MAGEIFVHKVMTDEEVRRVLIEKGYTPMPRKDGDIDLSEYEKTASAGPWESVGAGFSSLRVGGQNSHQPQFFLHPASFWRDVPGLERELTRPAHG